MILPALAAFLTALGPLLGGSREPWAQALVQLVVVAGLAAWLVARIFIGYIPIPSRRTLAWACLLAVLSGISAFRSPVPAVAAQQWRVFLLALWIFPAMGALSKDQRLWIDEAVRVCGWILMALVFYQRFALGEAHPESSLLSQEAYAGAVLLFLPLAAEKRDWLLATGLVISLWWTRSLGAWFGLSAAVLITQRGGARWRIWTGGAILLICGLAAYAKLGTPESMHRWWWWKAAIKMTLAHPWFGYGPGTFASVLPAYLSPASGGLNGPYACQYPLRICAEYGIPFAIVWFLGIFRCLTRNNSHKRFGALALLICSLADYSLPIPALFWLFAYFAASSIPDGSEGINVPFHRKIPACIAVSVAGLALSSRAWNYWKAGELSSAGIASMESRNDDAAREYLAEAERLAPDDAEIPRLEADIDVRSALASTDGQASGDWLRAASHLEKAVRLDPFRQSSWTRLSVAYRRLGRPDSSDQALRQAAAYRAVP